MRYAVVLTLVLATLLVGCKKELSCQEILKCQEVECRPVAEAPYSTTQEIEICLLGCARRGSVIGQRQFLPIDQCTDKARSNPRANLRECELLLAQCD